MTISEKTTIRLSLLVVLLPAVAAGAVLFFRVQSVEKVLAKHEDVLDNRGPRLQAVEINVGHIRETVDRIERKLDAMNREDRRR